MTDLVIFLFGLLVTVMCSGAIALFIYGAWQDGAERAAIRRAADPRVPRSSSPQGAGLGPHTLTREEKP